MCNDCRDISDRVNKTQNVSAGGTIWQLPSGVNLTSPTDGVVMRTGSTSSSLMGDDTIYYDNAFPSKTDILTFKGEMDVVAFECSLYPCVHTYNSTVRDTRTTEQLLSAFAMKPAIGLGPFAGSSNDPYFYSALPMPCLINGSYYDASSFTRPNLTNSIAVPGLLPHNKTGYVPPDCYFTFESPGLMQNLPGYLNGYVMEAPEVDDAEPGWLRQLFSVDNVTVVSVNQSWTNIANSMTVRVRQSPDGMNLSSTSGDAWHMETCISIRWPWLAYSAALLALAMVFLLATIAQSMHHSRKHLWKSSILAALFHGLDTDLREKFRHVDKSEEMERTAKRLVVRLGREEEESRLIEVPLSEQDQAKMTLKDLPRSEKHLAKLVSQGPRPLRPDSKLRLLGLAMELFICLLPISFIVLAITAKYLEGHEVSNYGERIKDWSMLAPSIFPLVFAAVIGQSLRSIARYKVEKGWKLKVRRVHT